MRVLLRDSGCAQAEIEGDVEVLQLTTTEPCIDDTHIKVTVCSASPVHLNPRAARGGGGGDDVAEIGEDGDVEAWLQDLGSDIESIASAGDEEGVQDLAAAAEESDPDSGKDVLGVGEIRAANGQYVIFRCDYYFIVNIPKCSDLRLNVYKRWLVAGELGAGQGQKQVTIPHHDVDDRDPFVSSLVLRAWFLHRCTRDGWFTRKSSRKLWRLREIDALKQAMHRVEHDSVAWRLILKSAPEVCV